MSSATEIPCTWYVSTAPITEPVTLAEAKAQARILDDNSDPTLTRDIIVAREAAEAYMGRAILTQTLKLVMGGFASIIPLPMAAPLQSVTSVQYYDADGTLQTLPTTYYAVDTTTRPGRVVLKPSQSWPTVQSDKRDGTVIITYVAGWTGYALVPERIKRGILQYVAFLEMDRDGLGGFDAKQSAERCWDDRIWWSAPSWGC